MALKVPLGPAGTLGGGPEVDAQDALAGTPAGLALLPGRHVGRRDGARGLCCGLSEQEARARLSFPPRR